MPEFVQTPLAQAVLMLAGLSALVMVGIYVVDKVRRGIRDSRPEVQDVMTNFRELHSQGELSDEEYRTIRAMLSPRLDDELTDKGHEA